jgi:peptidoglycan hydrolase-like protein with peptidoglycan-binding domain
MRNEWRKEVRRMRYTAFYKRWFALAALISCTCLPLGVRAAYETLQSGSKSEAVFKLEEALAMQGYFDAWPDQVYDDATVYGVKAFQTAHNLTADGIAGDETQTLLYGTLSGDINGGNAEEETIPSSVPMPATLRDLSLNRQGSDVESLQTRLTELGYYAGRISGSYGELTRAAVEAFQRANGLTADGIAGVRTQTKMYADTAVPASGTETDTSTVPDTDTSGVSYQTLKVGMKNEAVRQMQQKLKDLGYYSGTVSGNFGNVTWEAVRKFQKAKGLTADGVAGQKTLEQLYGTPSSGTEQPPQTDTSGDSSQVLKVGMKSDAVKQMQQKLKDLGYYSGTVSGNFGNVTWEAVRKFQKARV